MLVILMKILSSVERFRLSIVSIDSHTGHSDERDKSEYEKRWNKEMHRIGIYTHNDTHGHIIDIRII